MKIRTHKYALVAYGNNKIGRTPTNSFKACMVALELIKRNADKLCIDIVEIRKGEDCLVRWYRNGDITE